MFLWLECWVERWTFNHWPIVWSAGSFNMLPTAGLREISNVHFFSHLVPQADSATYTWNATRAEDGKSMTPVCSQHTRRSYARASPLGNCTISIWRKWLFWWNSSFFTIAVCDEVRDLSSSPYLNLRRATSSDGIHVQKPPRTFHNIRKDA